VLYLHNDMGKIEKIGKKYHIINTSNGVVGRGFKTRTEANDALRLVKCQNRRRQGLVASCHR